MTNSTLETLINQDTVDSIINDICVAHRMLLVSNPRMGFNSIKITFEPEYYGATLEELDAAFELDNYSNKTFGNYVITDVKLTKGQDEFNPNKIVAEFDFEEVN